MKPTVVCFLGKEYNDVVISVDKVEPNESNQCIEIKKRKGGIFNILEANLPNLTTQFLTNGSKEAYIVNERSNSSRTSYVMTRKDSILTEDQCTMINNQCDWLHLSYLDDFENYKNLNTINKPISVDFCTNNNREQYLKILKKCHIIFESRERKDLYSNMCISTPIIFHDEQGIEVVKNNKTVHKDTMVPIDNVDVNGAGDIYAAIFIDNYQNKGISKSASHAMRKTTEILQKRKQNEEI